ncbi:MAG: hypothetical protein U1F76_22725 [Candidatus Competibacteraceae bacterium]
MTIADPLSPIQPEEIKAADGYKLVGRFFVTFRLACVTPSGVLE